MFCVAIVISLEAQFLVTTCSISSLLIVTLYNTQLEVEFSLAVAGNQPYEKAIARKFGLSSMGKASRIFWLSLIKKHFIDYAQ